MSALFTSAGTSRARTAVKERRRVLARASMMASNRLCPLATELTGHLVLVLVEQRLPIRKPLCNWTGGRGGAAATREGRCGHTCTVETKLVLLWRWCTVHSARAHFTATAAGKTGSSLCETSNQPLGLPRPSSGISIASPSSKDQRAAFSKRPKKKQLGLRPRSIVGGNSGGSESPPLLIETRDWGENILQDDSRVENTIMVCIG